MLGASVHRQNLPQRRYKSNIGARMRFHPDVTNPKAARKRMHQSARQILNQRKTSKSCYVSISLSSTSLQHVSTEEARDSVVLGGDSDLGRTQTRRGGSRSVRINH